MKNYSDCLQMENSIGLRKENESGDNSNGL